VFNKVLMNIVRRRS